MSTSHDRGKTDLLNAALAHVAFDGWSDTCFRAAANDCKMDLTQARILCPRGAVDLAIAFHQEGDAQMRARLEDCDLNALRFSERIARAVRLRLEVVSDKEAVRRGVTLFALPQYAPEGARLIWNTCDQIWTLLGDDSQDVNWYTKRATLAGVYGAVVLFWLGDTSEDHVDTWAFLDRRIADVMQIEKAKGAIRQNPLLSRIFAGPAAVLKHIKAPVRRDDLPGRW